MVNGKHHTLAVLRKKHYVYNPNIACEPFFSYRDNEVNYEELRQQNDRYVEETGLPLGFTHAEYKYNGKEFVLIEIGARGGNLNYFGKFAVWKHGVKCLLTGEMR